MTDLVLSLHCPFSYTTSSKFSEEIDTCETTGNYPHSNELYSVPQTWALSYFLCVLCPSGTSSLVYSTLWVGRPSLSPSSSPHNSYVWGPHLWFLNPCWSGSILTNTFLASFPEVPSRYTDESPPWHLGNIEFIVITSVQLCTLNIKKIGDPHS